MKRDALRDELISAREHALAGDTETAVAELDRALAELAPRRLLSPIESAAALGIQSDLMVVLWCRSGFLAGEPTDGDPSIPVFEIERVMESDEVKDMRASDRLHDLSSALGSDEGMSDEELEISFRFSAWSPSLDVVGSPLCLPQSRPTYDPGGDRYQLPFCGTASSSAGAGGPSRRGCRDLVAVDHRGAESDPRLALDRTIR